MVWHKATYFSWMHSDFSVLVDVIEFQATEAFSGLGLIE